MTRQEFIELVTSYILEDFPMDETFSDELIAAINAAVNVDSESDISLHGAFPAESENTVVSQENHNSADVETASQLSSRTPTPEPSLVDTDRDPGRPGLKNAPAFKEQDDTPKEDFTKKRKRKDSEE